MTKNVSVSKNGAIVVPRNGDDKLWDRRNLSSDPYERHSSDLTAPRSNVSRLLTIQHEERYAFFF
jgi:hypothetical protein